MQPEVSILLTPRYRFSLWYLAFEASGPKIVSARAGPSTKSHFTSSLLVYAELTVEATGRYDYLGALQVLFMRYELLLVDRMFNQ
jgi:hypothetical protein